MSDDTKKKKQHGNVQEPEDEEIESLEMRVRDLDNQLKRAVADYINLQRRVEEEKKEIIKFANRDLLTNLLPALNMLFLAGKHTEDQGVKLTMKGILEVLKSVGVEKIETEGKKFDASHMEAVEVISGEEEKVMEEVRPGFTLYGKLLSPALVKVGGKKEN